MLEGMQRRDIDIDTYDIFIEALSERTDAIHSYQLVKVNQFSCCSHHGTLLY
jgi:hypothetical protein